jgi:protein arginine N-methyltransferase 1
MLTQPKVWARINYYGVENPNILNTIDWRTDQGGTMHGLGLWFDSSIDDEFSFSNAPHRPATIYGQAIFPLTRPVDLSNDSEVTCTLRADHFGSDYTWSWNTAIKNSTGAKASFKQSTFLGTPHVPAQLKKRNKRHIPTLNRRGHASMKALELMQVNASLADIAEHLTREFPDEFKDASQALAYVGDLSVLWSD